jgi:2,3-dihydroxybenzoate decarboxylase
MVSKIALEEHFLCPGFIEYWNPTVASMPAEKRDNLLKRCTDFGEQRIASMDAAGISRAVLSLAGPGVQAEPDERIAIRRARDGNDFLAREISRRPDRYSGFAHLPMQDAKAAATSWSVASRS